MALNLELPGLRKRAQREIDKLGQAADDAGKQVQGIQLPNNISLPSIDIGGTLDSARKALGDARRNLSEGGEQVSVRADHAAKAAGKVGQDIRHAVDDLRSVRIVRQQPVGRDPWPGVALIGGIAAGVAAMFLFDPRDGKRRRALLRDKLGKWSRMASDTAQGRAKDIANRSQGLLHDVRTAIPVGRAEEDDELTGEGTPDWASQEPVAAGVSADSGTSYGEMGYQPGAANGREDLNDR